MSVTSAQAITLLENVLFESPTIATANAASWVSQSATNDSLSSVAGLAAAMAATPEAGIAEQVVRYYMGALGRVPAGDEIQFYINVVEAGLTADQLAQGTTAVAGSQWAQIAAYFAASPEFANDFGLSTAGQVDSSNEVQVILAFYANILGRVPNSDEITYYQKLLDSGTSVATLVQYFTTSPEYQTSVDTNIATALGGYGTDVADGTTPPSIPLTPPGLTLGSSPLTVTGTSKTTVVSVVGTPAATAQTAQTAVTGVIPVAPVTAATGVQGVTGVTGVAAVSGRSAVTAVTDGAVTINDIASSATGAGVITTVYLTNSGAGSVINDNGLTSLTLIGTTGTLALTNINTAAITAHTSSLALVLNGLTNAANTVTDTNNEIATLKVTTTTADSVLAGFTDTHLATLNLAGSNMLTLLAINSSLTALNITGAASFSDGATTHTGGLAALGSHLTISENSTGTFTAALDDTTQTFTGGSGADVITVSALADATKTITAGSAKSGNEIVLEGGNYALTSASTGKFVNFQTVGVAANVTGTIDLSLVDATASGLEVIGANSGITFTKAASGASLLIDPSTSGAVVTLGYADSNGAKDSTTVTMSSAVSSLRLQDAAGVGIATLNIVNTLSPTESSTSLAHTIGILTDNGLGTLNVTGTAGLSITTLTETTTPATSLTLNNASTDGYGVTIGTLSDIALATLAFTGTGVSTVGTLNTSVASLSVTNSGTTPPLAAVGTINDTALTLLTLAANVALGQAATALTSNGLQDSSTAGVVVTGGSDNAHVTINLTSGAASGKTDAITLGNGNNVVVDSSLAGTVNVTLGSGANLVELGAASLDTTAKYNVTFAARTATAPNAVFIGAAGTTYNSAPNLVITGASTGDIIAFGNDVSSSGATLTATSLTSASSVANAITTLEGAVTGGAGHKVAYGVYGGNTYIVESSSGTLGVTDTVLVEVTGSQTLTASIGYVTLGNTASTLTTGSSLAGAGFTIPAGTATNLSLGVGGNFVTLTGPSSGVTDKFTSIAASTGLTINYQATSGTDTILMAGSAGNNASDIGALTVNDTSTGGAGVTIGAFTDNHLTSVTYNNDTSVSPALMTQQTLTSNSLNTINFTSSGSVLAENYLFSGVLSTSGTLTINDSNAGRLGTVTLGLVLTGGPSTLTLNMTGPGTLVTGTLPDNNLTTLNIIGSDGAAAVGTVIDSTTQGFTVNDTLSSAYPATIVLSGLSAASSLTVFDSAGQSLTDSSIYSDVNLTALTLTNTGAGTLTIGGGGLSISSPGGAANASQITIAGSSSGSIVTGTITDTGSGALVITDSYAATGTHAGPSTVTLPLDGSGAGFAVTSLTINDTSSAALNLGSLVDNALTSLSLSNTGSAALTFLGGMTVDALSTFNFTLGGTGSISIGNITDTVSAPVTVNVNSTSTASTTLGFNSTGPNLFNATSFSVDANTVAGLTISSLTANSASNLAFSNNGAGLLTISGITDNQATVHVNIPDTGNLISSSSGPMTINLIGAGSTLLDISDTGTGAVALNLATANAVQAIDVANGGAGASTITLTDTVAAATAITLTGSGNQSITLSDNGGTIILNGTGANAATGSYSFTLPTAVHVIDLPTTTLASNANTTVVTADHLNNFHLDTGFAIGDTLSFGGFTSAANVLTAADVNPGSAIVWTVTNGMMSSTNATVLNFIAAVQTATKAVTVAATSGIAGFYDGHGNTWIAYNDHSGSDVAVIELVGVSTAVGIESTGAQANFIHIA